MKEALKKLLRAPEVPKRRAMRRGRPKGLLAELCTQYMRNIPDTDQEVLAEYWEFFAAGVAKAFMVNLGGPNQYQVWRPRPSGQKCTREEGFKKLGIYKPPDTSAQGKFALGHIYEAWAKTVALLAGARIHSFNMKVGIPIPGSCSICKGRKSDSGGFIPGTERKGICGCGEIDFLLDIGDETWLGDVKSARGVAFKWITNPYKDKWGYFKQQKAYLMSEELQKLGVTKGFLFFVSKATASDFKEVYVPEVTDGDHDRWFEHCALLNRCTSIPTLPPRPEWATTRTKSFRKEGIKPIILEAIQCNLCDVKNNCWGRKWKLRKGTDNEWYS